MANNKKPTPQFIQLTSAEKGTRFRINTSEIGMYVKPEWSDRTTVFMTGDSGTKFQVKETPDEIDKMLGINFMD
jgi:hypothetical protein